MSRDTTADAGTRLAVPKTYKLYIGGAFPRSESGRTYDVRAADGAFLANAAKASRKDARDAVVAARGAVAGWAGATSYNRGQVLYRIAELLEGRRAQFVAEIEQSEGRKARYHFEAIMIHAKRVQRAEQAAKPDVAAITSALAEYESLVNAAERLPADGKKVDSSFLDSAKSFLVSAKQLMRRVRDKVPYSQGDRMMMNSGGGWMVEGSPARVLRDYNQLIDAYNRGNRF